MAAPDTVLDVLSPLPPVVRAGSIAISVFAYTSFFSALILFIYLTCKIVSWQLGRSNHKDRKRSAAGHTFTNGPIEFGPAHDAAKLTSLSRDPEVEMTSRAPNQFLVLILNLLVADLLQAAAFLLSSAWVARDGIWVHTAICFTQGLFVSVGDLASSCFMSAVAIHTFFSVVKGIRPSHKILYIGLTILWCFVYLISLLPLAGTLNGAAAGGFFVRAGAWCWINEAYGDIRLLTHYIFIFIAIALSWTLYTAIFCHLRRQHKRGQLGENKTSGHHPAFLIYPVIYLLCILPLAVGRVASMAGKDPPLGYFCFAGALTASNGWLDVLLFIITRKTIVFAHGDELGNEDTGVNTFTFMSPTPTTFGNTIWVWSAKRDEQRDAASGWWRILGDSDAEAQRKRSLSQTSLAPTEQNAIQMEVVTSIVVEHNN
ncbi:hypothetical protein GGR57DRAFT_229358 [Xylariaceae sp. FL1272]|nr:hypothetical protein GGR57DRAFT_229358 [Xylariaceae sp. FL1272]